jgi:radical SAM protein with 4Fe4S-binding SPASM domain
MFRRMYNCKLMQYLSKFKKNDGEKKNDAWVDAYNLDKIPMPVEVEIETVNRCNGICPFCPVNVNEVQRPYAKMTENLFYKIISELKEMDYSHNIAIFSNNEPFLDERIIEFQKYAREQLPKAFCHMYTNGTIVTLDKFIAIMPFLDRLTIDNYNDDMKINSSLKEIYEYVQLHAELQEKVVFSMRKQNVILNSRGGFAPNKKGIAVRSRAKCVLPFQQLIVRPDGKVSLCCADALGKYTMGDLNNNTIQQVWSSGKYLNIRAEMKKNGRKNLMLCNKCDQVGGSFQ